MMPAMIDAHIDAAVDGTAVVVIERVSDEWRVRKLVVLERMYFDEMARIELAIQQLAATPSIVHTESPKRPEHAWWLDFARWPQGARGRIIRPALARQHRGQARGSRRDAMRWKRRRFVQALRGGL